MRPSLAVAAMAAVGAVPLTANAQPAHHSGPYATACLPVAERAGREVGCWIVAQQPIGRLADPQAFWHLDAFPGREVAEAAKAPGGVVVEAFGRTWLLTIGGAGWRPSAGGERIAEIGPLPVTAGESYAVQYMEAIFTPGMTSSVHTHPGPEAWHTLTGETCLETPDGRQVGRAGGPPVIVPGGPPMHLTATGTETRRALVLILHDASRPAIGPARDWTPRGLCRD